MYDGGRNYFQAVYIGNGIRVNGEQKYTRKEALKAIEELFDRIGSDSMLEYLRFLQIPDLRERLPPHRNPTPPISQ